MADGCRDCKWTGKVPFLWHATWSGEDRPIHVRRSCVAACSLCELGSVYKATAMKDRPDANDLIQQLKQAATKGNVVEWWAGYDTPASADREIGERVRAANAEARS